MSALLRWRRALFWSREMWSLKAAGGEVREGWSGEVGCLERVAQKCVCVYVCVCVCVCVCVWVGGCGCVCCGCVGVGVRNL